MSSNLPTFLSFNDDGTKLNKFNFDFVSETDYMGYKTVNSVSIPTFVQGNSVWGGPSPWGYAFGNSSANIVIQIPSPAQVSSLYVLRADGSWGPGGGGGGSTPGGSNSQIQFNDSGTFGADSAFAFDKTAGVLSIGNSTVNNQINSTFIGGKSIANLVTNAQLIANLANYTNTSQLTANYPNNTQLSANLAGYQPAGSYLTSVPTAYVQNTDSRTLSGNLVFSGANVFFSSALFVGANVVVNSTTVFIGNSSANAVQNASGFYLNGSAVGSLTGAVLYSSSQSLTAAQAAQART